MLRELEVTFESKGLKVNIWKTKVVVSGDFKEEGLSKSKFCAFCLKVMANSVLCAQCGGSIHSRCAHCGGSIHSRCAEAKRVTHNFSGNFV